MLNSVLALRVIYFLSHVQFIRISLAYRGLGKKYTVVKYAVILGFEPFGTCY